MFARKDFLCRASRAQTHAVREGKAQRLAIQDFGTNPAKFARVIRTDTIFLIRFDAYFKNSNEGLPVYLTRKTDSI